MRFNEMVNARTALICAGWTVATSETQEAFDIVARDPLSGEWKTFQVKTIRRVKGGSFELDADIRKISVSSCDYVVGVLGAEGSEAPRVWIIEILGKAKRKVEKSWIELPLRIQRDAYTFMTPGK